MIGTVIAKIFGTQTERDIKRMQPTVAQISALEPQMQQLTDEQLRAKTQEFRERIQQRLAAMEQPAALDGEDAQDAQQFEKRQNEETEKSEEFRGSIELKIDKMRESVATGFVQGAVFGERMTRLEQELERKRLQHHELANRVASLEARLDARIEAVERRMVRKEGS